VAFAALHSKDLTPSWKRKIVVVLDLASARSELTEEQVDNLLFDFIDKSSPTTVGPSNIDRFMDTASLLKGKLDREKLEAKFLLKKALDYRVIFEKQGTYTWNRKTGPLEIGATKSESEEFLLNPKKQALVEELEEEIKAKSIN